MTYDEALEAAMHELNQAFLNWSGRVLATHDQAGGSPDPEEIRAWVNAVAHVAKAAVGAYHVAYIQRLIMPEAMAKMVSSAAQAVMADVAQRERLFRAETL